MKIILPLLVAAILPACTSFNQVAKGSPLDQRVISSIPSLDADGAWEASQLDDAHTGICVSTQIISW